jgi:hypothetical protein
MKKKISSSIVNIFGSGHPHKSLFGYSYPMRSNCVLIRESRPFENIKKFFVSLNYFLFCYRQFYNPKNLGFY